MLSFSAFEDIQLVFDVGALTHQRCQFGIAGHAGRDVWLQVSDLGQRTVPARAAGLSPDAVAGVVQQRTLGGELALPLEVILHVRAGVGEGFEERHLPVLVEIGLIVVERLDEELRKDRLELLRRIVARRQHDPSTTRELGQKREAAARGVDEDDPPRDRLDERRPFVHGQIGTDQVELGVVRVGGAVSDQQNDGDVAVDGALAQIGECGAHALAR